MPTDDEADENTALLVEFLQTHGAPPNAPIHAAT